MNTTENTTAPIQLTAAELELINMRRQQEEIDAKERALKAQVKLEKDILYRQSLIHTEQEDAKAQLAACELFVLQLGSDWKVCTKERTFTKEITDYSNMDDVKVVWSQQYNIIGSWIEKVVSNFKFTVTVKEHFVSSGSSWRSESKSQGYRMFLSGNNIDYSYSNKALKSTDTVNKKVNEVVSAAREKAEQAKRKLNAVEQTVAKFKLQFPEATVTSAEDYTRHASYGPGKDRFETFNKVTVVFLNGVSISYKVYSDGSLSHLATNFGGISKDPITFMSKLQSITI